MITANRDPNAYSTKVRKDMTTDLTPGDPVPLQKHKQYTHTHTNISLTIGIPIVIAPEKKTI